jgi:tetratricopeptide (TPR) repeat protein
MDPNFPVAFALLGQAYAGKEMYREALTQIEKYQVLSRDSAMSLALAGYVHGRMGQRSQALREIQQLADAAKHRYTPAFAQALIYAGMEDRDQAVVWLNKSYEERFARLAYLKHESLWDPVRSDPRFTELLSRIGLPQ